MAETVETGDLFFLYRNVVGVDRAGSLDDVQHLYLVMVPDGEEHGRVLVVGRKRLPEVEGSRSGPEARSWAMTLASGPPERLGRRFRPLGYETETEGSRLQAEAAPAGSGRYAIRAFGDGEDTFLLYRLARPARPGEAQAALGIRDRAGYVVAVRNPEVEVEGFPDERPDYPERLARRFADLRWIEVDDPGLLDPPAAQLVLIGALTDVDADEPGLSGDPDLFAALGLDRDGWPDEALEEGTFAEARYRAPPLEPRGDRSEAGRRGGRAALDAPSAAGIARALRGIDFPAGRDDLVARARENDAAEEILATLADLADRRYRDMAEVETALSEVR